MSDEERAIDRAYQRWRSRTPEHSSLTRQWGELRAELLVELRAVRRETLEALPCECKYLARVHRVIYPGLEPGKCIRCRALAEEKTDVE